MIVEYNGSKYVPMNDYIKHHTSDFSYVSGFINLQLVTKFFNENIPNTEKLILIYEDDYEVLKNMVDDYGDSRYLPPWVKNVRDEKIKISKTDECFIDYCVGMYISLEHYKKIIF